MRPQSPCFDCEDRQLNCHSKCEEYLKYRDKLNSFNEKVAKQMAFEQDINAVKYGKYGKRK